MQAFRRLVPVISLLLAGLLTAGCEFEQTLDQIAQQKSRQTTSSNLTAPVPPRDDADTIRIASFNIQVFGTSKLKKPQAMGVLVEAVRRFDVVAIQEVRSKDQTVLQRFVEMINADGGAIMTT